MDAPGTAAGAGGGVPGRRALLAAATVDAPFPSAEHIATESVVPKAKGPGCVDTLDLHRRHLSGVAPQANASGILYRASCSMVRLYVAKYTAAEAWARSKGPTDAGIEAARLCLKDGPVQTATTLSSTPH
jgi:hypothetical protein